MDKRTAWVSWILFLGISFGLGGMYYGQTERIDVLQRETKEKDTQIQALIAQSQSQLKEQQQKISELQQKIEVQQKNIAEIKKNANF